VRSSGSRKACSNENEPPNPREVTAEAVLTQAELLCAAAETSANSRRRHLAFSRAGQKVARRASEPSIIAKPGSAWNLSTQGIKRIYERTLRHSSVHHAAPFRQLSPQPQDRAARYRRKPASHRTRWRHLHYPALGRRHGRPLLPHRMHIPPGGGPPPHRHDFEESFTVLEGEIQTTFRGEKSTVHAGQTVSIPANAPHSFTNASGAAARLLCICAPAGQEEFFAQVGAKVPTRRSTPPELDQKEQAELMKKSKELAPKYRTELLPP
jgi:quercetin dioxygenase-like cupin family protein